MKKRRPLVALLALSTLCFATLAVSAFLFLRLPPAPTPLTNLGWSPTAGETPRLVLLTHVRRQAWVVYSHAACYVDLDTARARHCVALPEPFDFGGLHAYGHGRLLLARQSPHSNHSVQFAIITEEGALHAGEYTQPTNTFLRGLAWDDALGRFQLFLERFDSKRWFEAVELSPDGVIGASSPIATPQAVSSWDVPRAFFVGRHASALFTRLGTTTPGLYELDGDSLHVVDPSCRDCALTAADSSYWPVDRSASRWFDSSGREIRLSLSERRGARNLGMALVEDTLEEGSSEPLITYVDADMTRAKMPIGEAEFSTQERGGESVLLGQIGRPRPIARDVTTSWLTVIPSHGGFVLIDDRGRAAIVDYELERTPKPNATSAVREVLAERWHIDPAGVLIYLFGLLAFLPLAAFAGRALIANRASRWLPWAIGTHVLLVGYLLIFNHNYLFPP